MLSPETSAPRFMTGCWHVCKRSQTNPESICTSISAHLSCLQSKEQLSFVITPFNWPPSDFHRLNELHVLEKWGIHLPLLVLRWPSSRLQPTAGGRCWLWAGCRRAPEQDQHPGILHQYQKVWGHSNFRSAWHRTRWPCRANHCTGSRAWPSVIVHFPLSKTYTAI